MVPPMRPGRQSGFTYIAVLLGVAIIAAGLAAVGSVWHTMLQRENEKALLFAGNQFRVAINRYFLANQRYPMRLEDFLSDGTKPGINRYLRKIFFDPLTNRSEWGLMQLANGQIVGVYSLSALEPLQKRGFRARDESFKNRKKYSEWLFLADGQALHAQPAGANIPGSSQPM